MEEKVAISSIKTVSNVAFLSCSISKTLKNISDCQAMEGSVKKCGILNKGNTCYIKAALQCLSSMVQFWSSFNTVFKILSPFVSSFVKIMSLLKSSKFIIDPSQFLKLLKQVVLKSGMPHFNIFEQQDAREMWPLFWMNFVVISFLSWTWCKSRPGLVYTLCFVTRVDNQYQLSVSCSKHSAVLFRFIFTSRKLFGT